VSYEELDEARVVPSGAPMDPGERRVVLRDYDAALIELRTFAGAPQALEDLRRLLAADPCAPVHQLSDAGLLREIAARVHHGELELRVRDLLG
jgi:hypothetical protein